MSDRIGTVRRLAKLYQTNTSLCSTNNVTLVVVDVTGRTVGVRGVDMSPVGLTICSIECKTPDKEEEDSRPRGTISHLSSRKTPELTFIPRCLKKRKRVDLM